MSDLQLSQIVWDYMRYEQPLEKADVILALGSADLRSAQWAAELYKMGYAPKILFSGARGRISRDVLDSSEAEVYRDHAITLGVSATDILIETTSENTGENIRFSHNRLLEENLTVEKLIVITKPYMLRRTYATFVKQWPGKPNPKLILSAINQTMEEYCKDLLYPFEYVVNVMTGDLQRIKEYPKLGFQIEQAIPEDVWQAYEELVSRGYTKQLIK